MKRWNKQTGNLAEDVATKTLMAKGFSIVERNFSNRFGEIDIIAKEHDTFVFVEVKAKTGVTYGTPEEMLTKQKLRQVQHMATVYMQGKTLPCRIDVVAVVFSPGHEVLSVTHYENVYL